MAGSKCLFEASPGKGKTLPRCNWWDSCLGVHCGTQTGAILVNMHGLLIGLAIVC